MRILVTGGNGYLGSRIVSSLVRAGHAVRTLDRVAVPEWEPRQPAIEATHGDITDETVCEEACRDVDVVVHCAAVHLASSVSRQPLLAIRTNVEGTLNMLRGAVKGSVSRFVFLSSAKVYGEPERLPSEEGDVLRPLEPYALSKAVCESYCERFTKEAGLQTVVLRPFSVYGPAQDLETGYVGMIIRALLDQQDPTLPGRPDYLRDFVFVDDVVGVCARSATEPRAMPPVLNVGEGRGVSLARIVDIFSDLTARRILPRYVEPSPGTIMRTEAGMAKTMETFGIRRMTRLEEGLRATLESFFGGGHAAPGRSAASPVRGLRGPGEDETHR